MPRWIASVAAWVVSEARSAGGKIIHHEDEAGGYKTAGQQTAMPEAAGAR